MPATLTNAQMQAVINNGGSVSFGPGQVYDAHNIADLPTDEEIAVQLAAEALDDAVTSASVTTAIAAAEADDVTAGNVTAAVAASAAVVRPVAAGGTGTSTAFTSTAVVFAGASGVYSQDASFFTYNSTLHVLSVGAGTGTARPTVGGIIFDHFADVASAGTDDETETMYTDNIPANTFAANGAKISAEYSAVTVAHATATRGFAVRIAGEMFLQTDSFATVAINHISFRVVLIRKDATHLRYIAVCEASNATGVVIKHYVKTGETGAVTLSDVNALDFLALVGGVGAAAADVVAKMGTVMYFPPA